MTEQDVCGLESCRQLLRPDGPSPCYCNQAHHGRRMLVAPPRLPAQAHRKPLKGSQMSDIAWVTIAALVCLTVLLSVAMVTQSRQRRD